MIFPLPHDPRPHVWPPAMHPSSASNRRLTALWQASEFSRFAAQMDGLGYAARAVAMRREESYRRAVAAEFATGDAA